MMNLAILGSTGSVGTSTLAVVSKYPDRFKVAGLAAGSNVELLAQQIRIFTPQVVCVGDDASRDKLAVLLSGKPSPELLTGQDGMRTIATLDDADMIIQAVAGAAGLLPTVAAVGAGKKIGLANKESLVMAGALIMAEAQRTGSAIIPIDSEHSALFQLLSGQRRENIRSIILTASGGPFLGHALEDLERVQPIDALQHPRWKMGRKITTDSASLMNKGLEIIEAHWLFGMPADKIQVVIHPESIIHSMVAFIDGTVIAQMSHPDMRAPIAYALSCPERLDNVIAPLDFATLGRLTFQTPDMHRFPSLQLAYDALAAGGLMPAVMNAANEVAVQKFHEHELSFTSIPRLVREVMEHFNGPSTINLESILWADRWARAEAERLLHKE
ncbi:MAG: 1-deoxy-D-xylulose-5-phosphate reductoisomerase [Desulfobacterota bacterium]|nr:1-deoxy-D-xylulose-5-phosphate reductoisomerase [Thermodesulfobacteriota bacterium]